MGCNPRIRDELVIMCSQFVTGATLTTVSGNTSVCLATMRARRVMLVRLNIKMRATMIHGRGYGTPFYVLDEPLESAIAKIDAKYSAPPAPKKKKEKRVEERDEVIRAGRHPGIGIESWLFIERNRAKAYLDFCDDWAVPGQKKKDIYPDEPDDADD